MSSGPCCKTFSRADPSNSGRGTCTIVHHYRLHGEGHWIVWNRPPKDAASEKGLAAHAEDRMVQQGVGEATAAHERGVPFYMKNPVGSTSLWRRPYMLAWVKKKWLVAFWSPCGRRDEVVGRLRRLLATSRTSSWVVPPPKVVFYRPRGAPEAERSA